MDRIRSIKMLLYTLQHNTHCGSAPSDLYVYCSACPLNVGGRSCAKGFANKLQWVRDNVSEEELLEALL